MLKKLIITTLSQFENENFSGNFPLDYCLPVYHNVSNEHLPHLKHIINYKNEKEFEADLDCLSKHFQWVTFDEFKDYVKGNFKPKKKIALLTFDDGYREFYDVVIPILKRKGIYAMNFINPAFTDNKDLMFRCKVSLLKDKFQQIHYEDKFLLKLKYQDTKTINDLAMQFEVDFEDYLKEKRPYLSSDELYQIRNKGFGISSHGWNHPLYHDLPLSEQLENTFQGYSYMKENGFHYESFAFPFTDFGVEKVFFDTLFKNEDFFCTFGSAGVKTDSVAHNFQRIPMETGENARMILKKEISYFRFKKHLNKNHIQRK
ncbi:polysaccharide deacetylase family protein [Chryseobacterium caseinilyticum]|uniref:Polysaccharide deacetylase family protein n=1 Tax=Chryseobacterium caseinilyticum TaxID=2771428 RepID=A0ABR8ZBC7_9FLAO|nr:polysaccharide deacetylase family protein [Chryseobacterium caseinilyticum]MBD8082536.1 polysaccharide deacetylase family protein [Chryseobacterium caseinilyticum]